MSRKRKLSAPSEQPNKRQRLSPPQEDVSAFLEDESDDDLTEFEWDGLPLSERTKSALLEMGHTTMMEIQSRAIPYLLEGKNLVGAAQTGSGKTLAFMIPVIERLKAMNWSPDAQGVGALIITPTRELAIQIFEVTNQLLARHRRNLRSGLVIGGNPRPSEKARILDGFAICVSTPGRLLDHLMRTDEFIVSNLKILVFDEADRLLEEGFTEELSQILKHLPVERQTILFSATQTRRTQDLIRLSFTSKPVMISIDNAPTGVGHSKVPVSLSQGYVCIPADKKFLLLYSFLKRVWESKKVIVFFSTVASTKFYVELLNYIDLEVHGLFGSMSQKKRSATFTSFVSSETGVLLATNVASRGLDFPNVDWIIQYDPPTNVKDYIHRVGRTARGKEGSGKALLMLIPEEMKFLDELANHGIDAKEYKYPVKKIGNIQNQLEKLTSSVYTIHVLAHQAYTAYMREYALRSSDTFDVLNLNIIDVAKSFGLSKPPKVGVEVRNVKKNRKTKKMEKTYKTVPLRLKTNEWARKGRKSQFRFSAENPYG